MRPVGVGEEESLPKFGDLEAEIMDRVWAANEPVRIREVVEGIRTVRPVAFTTVQTVMEILHRKGWLDRVKEGRAYRYWATAPREEYTAQLLSEALGTTSDRQAAFSRLLGRLQPAEVTELRQALNAVRQAQEQAE